MRRIVQTRRKEAISGIRQGLYTLRTADLFETGPLFFFEFWRIKQKLLSLCQQGLFDKTVTQNNAFRTIPKSLPSILQNLFKNLIVRLINHISDLLKYIKVSAQENAEMLSQHTFFT